MSKYKVGDKIRRANGDSFIPTGTEAVVHGIDDRGYALINYKNNANYSIVDEWWELIATKFELGMCYKSKDFPSSHYYDCIWADEYKALLKARDNPNDSSLYPHNMIEKYRQFTPPVTRKFLAVINNDGSGTLIRYEQVDMYKRDFSRFWKDKIATKWITITEGEFDVK